MKRGLHPDTAISVDIPAKEGFKRGIAIFHILTMLIFYFYERIVLVYDIQVHRLMEQGYNFNTYEDLHLYFFESEHNELNLYIFRRVFILTYSKILISGRSTKP